MALSGPVLVVSDGANDVCEALTHEGNLPMREALPAAAAAAVSKVKPSAIVLAGCTEDIADAIHKKAAKLDGPEMGKKLLSEIVPRYQSRPGGFTRTIMNLVPRSGHGS